LIRRRSGCPRWVLAKRRGFKMYSGRMFGVSYISWSGDCGV